MIPEAKLQEIRNYLKKAENPLFFYDDDCDGLCSYLLLKKYTNNSKGVIVKAPPELDVSFYRKVEENSPDLIIVLDKPKISQDFIDKVHVPILWIDHHGPYPMKGVHYYNPLNYDKDDSSPVTYWSYKISKTSLWIATVGSVADNFIPEFIDDFIDKYPKVLDKVKEPLKILYETNLGKLIKIMSFLLKGKTSEVYNNINILNKIEDPTEILEGETPRAKFLLKKFEKINKVYNQVLEKALDQVKKEKLFVFIYPSSKISLSRDLANELLYKLPDKIILVAREKDDNMRISMRSKSINLQKLLEKALFNVDGYGGGHEFAVGGNITKKDFNKFINNIKKEVK